MNGSARKWSSLLASGECRNAYNHGKSHPLLRRCVATGLYRECVRSATGPVGLGDSRLTTAVGDLAPIARTLALRRRDARRFGGIAVGTAGDGYAMDLAGHRVLRYGGDGSLVAPWDGPTVGATVRVVVSGGSHSVVAEYNDPGGDASLHITVK